MEQPPSINDPVVLRDQAGREYRSRVEDLRPGLMVVARPHDLPADQVFGPGTELQVAWATTRGMAVLPTRIMAEHVEGSLRLWSLAVTGAETVEQRRRFVRVPTTGPVVLRPAEDTESDPVTGNLIDVSEGGVRCAVEAGAADAFVTGRNEVTAEFRVGDREFAVPGAVEHLRPSAKPWQLEELVVVFDEPVKDADALRKELYSHQIRSLRTRDDDR